MRRAWLIGLGIGSIAGAEISTIKIDLIDQYRHWSVGRMDNAEIFIEKYKQLEHVVRETYGLNQADSISYFLSQTDRFRKNRADIRYCQEIRNWLQHEKKVNSEFAILPNDAVIEFIDNLISRIAGRKRCADIAIRGKAIYCRSMTDSVKETMREMRRCMYTNVPILGDNRQVIGVFDENSVFDYLADAEIIEVDNELRFEAIQKYISVSNRDMEEFIFVKPTVYVDDLEEKVEKAFHRGSRVGMVFLTADGKPDSPLLGIVTPWDIIAGDQDW